MGFFSRKPNVGKLQKDKDIDSLLEALEHKDLRIKREAAMALGGIKDPKCVNQLVSKISVSGFMPSSEVALWGDIAWALGEIGDGKAVEPLKDLQKVELSSSIGSGGSFEDMMKLAAEAKNNMSYLKEQVSEALRKIG